jgi:hypothetical protein
MKKERTKSEERFALRLTSGDDEQEAVLRLDVLSTGD